MKTVALTDFLTKYQIQDCLKAGEDIQQILAVIEPHMDEINQKLGQENDPKYLAYAIQYALSHRKQP